MIRVWALKRDQFKINSVNLIQMYGYETCTISSLLDYEELNSFKSEFLFSERLKHTLAQVATLMLKVSVFFDTCMHFSSFVSFVVILTIPLVSEQTIIKRMTPLCLNWK